MAQVDRNLLKESDEVIESEFAKLGYFASIDNLQFMPATAMDEFRAARKKWYDQGRLEYDDDRYLAIWGVQADKWQTRKDVVVIRFGDYCAIYDTPFTPR